MSRILRFCARVWPMIVPAIIWLVLAILSSVVDRVIPQDASDLQVLISRVLHWLGLNYLWVMAAGSAATAAVAISVIHRQDATVATPEKAMTCGRPGFHTTLDGPNPSATFAYTVFNGNPRPVSVTFRELRAPTYDSYANLIFYTVTGIDKPIPAFEQTTVSMTFGFVGPSGEQLKADILRGETRAIDVRGLELKVSDGARLATLRAPEGFKATRHADAWVAGQTVFMRASAAL